MIIPTKITFEGDEQAGKKLISRGHSEIRILEKTKHQDYRTVTISPGVIIECFSSNGKRRMNIIVESGDAQPERAEAMECFCDSCFAIGKIVEVFQGTGEESPGPLCSFYDVDVCHESEDVYRFARFEGVIAVDYGVYEIGQLVMLTNMINDDTSFCCPDLPAENSDMCKFTTSDVTNDDAFPVIIPVCLASGESYSMWERKLVVS